MTSSQLKHVAQKANHRGATVSVGALINALNDVELNAEVRKALETAGIEFIDPDNVGPGVPPPDDDGATGGVDSKHRSPERGPIQPRAPPSRMLRFIDVIELTGLSRTTIWRRVRAGTFPAPKKLGANSVGWREQTIVDHLDSLPTVSYAADVA